MNTASQVHPHSHVGCKKVLYVKFTVMQCALNLKKEILSIYDRDNNALFYFFLQEIRSSTS